MGEFESHIREIWKRGWFTNNGPLLQELESRLKKFLGLHNLLVVNNGTMALQLAIRALDLKGEIITTPFSYVATTSSIVWQGCRPVFADIHPETLNIDPANIEPCITGNTTAILATHVFGNPCDVEAIGHIARKHNLKVIYDAAHCFGTTYKGESIYHWGDISTTSFHATKLFQTIEGGAVITRNSVINDRLDLMRNFGHVDYGVFIGAGINGKNSEVHAAMGLCNLNYIDDILRVRKQQYERYAGLLHQLNARTQQHQPGSDPNGCYFALVFENGKEMQHHKTLLEKADIWPRQYFCPELSSLDYVDPQFTPVARAVAESVLCLPMYHTLSDDDQARIAGILTGKHQAVI